MLADNALSLATDAHRAHLTGTLRPYADDLVRNTVRETRMYGAQLDAARLHVDQIQSDDAAVCSLTVSALAMKRNKRCLMAYHAQRLDSIKDRFWAAAASSNTLLAPSRSERACLSPGEADFVRAYSRLVTQYKGAYVHSLDIATPSLDRPPRDLHVQVRVLKDVGQVVGEWGVLDLKKDDVLSVVRPDVERLIVSGVLEEINT